jgi:hypothetical protein
MFSAPCLASTSSTTAVADSVVCYPLRVYKAIDNENYYMRPQGFTAQIQFYGDVIHDKPIVSGPIYFFKQVLKQL